MKAFVGAAAIALSGATVAVAPAQAAMISGQLDITGIVNVSSSDFTPGGMLDFEGDGTVNIATGDFSGLLGNSATLFDLSFAGSEDVYTTGGFTYTANNFFDFDNDFPGRGFSSTGVISGAGFDDTPGMLTLSTQANNGQQVNASFSSSTTTTPIPLPASVLMLMAALGGLGFVSRRRSETV